MITLKVACPQCNGKIFETTIDKDRIARNPNNAASRDFIVFCPSNHPNKIHLQLDDLV